MSQLATWFTPSLSAISRSKGRSVTAAAAYRACVRIKDERLGETHDYRKKKGHLFTKLFGADDMHQLWNAAEKSEVRKNSTVGKELMLPLPADWSLNEQVLYCSDIAQHLQTTYGVAVQVDIHDKHNNKNTHAHILFTTRAVLNGKFGSKTRELDDQKTGEVSRLREAVCDITNRHAKANGSDWFAYAKKFKDIDEHHIPMEHIYRSDTDGARKNKHDRNASILVFRQARELIASLEARIAIEEAMKTSNVDTHAAASTPDNSLVAMTKPLPAFNLLADIAQQAEWTKVNIEKIDLQTIDITTTLPQALEERDAKTFTPPRIKSVPPVAVSPAWIPVGEQIIPPVSAASLLMAAQHNKLTRRRPGMNSGPCITPGDNYVHTFDRPT
jgi:hypothetical protein